MERSFVAIFFSGFTYFIHFLALGFASFPLQTHLRSTLGPSSASLAVTVVPIAACLTFFVFRYAQSQGWMRSPQRVLFAVAVGVFFMQAVLGWRLHATAAGNVLVAPVVDIALCLLFLGCVQSSCMTLLNHIGVSTMGDLAYTVRAAGSAGYMLALILMGTLASDEGGISDYHMYLGSCISVVHAGVALAACWLVDQTVEHVPMPKVSRSLPSVRQSTSAGSEAISKWPSWFRWEWVGLLILVWMVAACEMSYGLYSHEFLTQMFGNKGYFVFAAAVAIEIGLLLIMPVFPRLKRRLLFVGPVGWILLFGGCLVATQGLGAFGLFGLSLALNCPFQVSANEHAHRMNRSIMGVASMTLAQSIGYTTTTIVASLLANYHVGPAMLWSIMMPVACVSLVLAMRILARENALFDVDDLGQPESVARSGGVASPEERANDFKGELRADDPSPHAQDVHVVVFDPLPSRISVMAQTGSDAGELVGSHANANT